ncbi:MAG: FISUMP domain-containing protein [Flavobacteriales bacterium]
MTVYAQRDFVQIDTLSWSIKNLDVTTFRNGDPIRNAKTREEWIDCLNNAIPAYCDYRNDTTLGRIYGHLYNWFAIADPRGLAPIGSRVSNNRDWSDLCIYMNEGVYNWENMGLVSQRLRSKHSWKNSSSGENYFDFNLLPGGYRNENGEFVGLGMETSLWVRDTMSYGVVSQGNALTSPFALINGSKSDILFPNDAKKSGCYVRLVIGHEFGLSSKIPKRSDEDFINGYDPNEIELEQEKPIKPKKRKGDS